MKVKQGEDERSSAAKKKKKKKRKKAYILSMGTRVSQLTREAECSQLLRQSASLERPTVKLLSCLACPSSPAVFSERQIKQRETSNGMAQK